MGQYDLRERNLSRRQIADSSLPATPASPRLILGDPARRTSEQLPFDLTAIVMVLQGKLRVINEYEGFDLHANVWVGPRSGTSGAPLPLPAPPAAGRGPAATGRPCS